MTEGELEELLEQQKKLDQTLDPLELSPQAIAYFGCGGPSLASHLSRKYRPINLSDVDLRGVTSGAGKIPLPSEEFDLVVSFKTTLWDSYEPYRCELMRICKPGGRVFLANGRILELHKHQV